VSDVLAPLSPMLLAACLALLFYSLRPQAKLSRLTREYARQRAVTGQAARAARRDVARTTIIRNFNSLVDKEDYTKNEKKEIIERLVEISKCG
jgi:hypothetical protein